MARALAERMCADLESARPDPPHARVAFRVGALAALGHELAAGANGSLPQVIDMAVEAGSDIVSNSIKQTGATARAPWSASVVVLVVVWLFSASCDNGGRTGGSCHDRCSCAADLAEEMCVRPCGGLARRGSAVQRCLPALWKWPSRQTQAGIPTHAQHLITTDIMPTMADLQSTCSTLLTGVSSL